MTAARILALVLCQLIAAHALAAKRLCAPASADAKAARLRLEQLTQHLASAAEDAAPAPLVKELDALLASRCFEIASGDAPSLEDASLAALELWWRDGGGHWLEGQLSGDSSSGFPPDLRSDLSRATHHKDAIKRLLCAPGDRRCSAATTGWVERATTHFNLLADADDPWSPGYTMDVYQHPPPTPTPTPTPTGETRDRETYNAPLWRCAHPQSGTIEYETWRECVRGLRRHASMMPTGAIRPPSEGWLVIEGRRGHYHFVDGIAAYHLGTGAYYAVGSSSGLALRHDGSVDGDRTDAGRRQSVELGRLSVDNLRELMWMLLIREEVVRGYPNGDSFPIPPGLDVRIPDHEALRGWSSGSMSFSSAQTRLHWSWFVDGKRIAEGDLTWPNSYQPAEQHAVELLRVAEAGLDRSCPPVPLPTLELGCVAGVSHIDASSASLCAAREMLAKRLAAAKCGAP